MKNKELELIDRAHREVEREIQFAEREQRPSLVQFVRRAILEGKKLRLKPAADIIKEQRERFVRDCSCNSGLAFEDVFLPPAEFTAELKAWKKRKQALEASFKAYCDEAHAIMARATSEEINCEQAVLAIRQAARKHKIIS